MCVSSSYAQIYPIFTHLPCRERTWKSFRFTHGDERLTYLQQSVMRIFVYSKKNIVITMIWFMCLMFSFLSLSTRGRIRLCGDGTRTKSAPAATKRDALHTGSMTDGTESTHTHTHTTYQTHYTYSTLLLAIFWDMYSLALLCSLLICDDYITIMLYIYGYVYTHSGSVYIRFFDVITTTTTYIYPFA